MDATKKDMGFPTIPTLFAELMLLLLFGAGLAMVRTGIYIPTSYTTFGESPLRWAGSLLVPWIVLGLTAVAAGLVAVSSFVTDLVLAWLDPRVRSRA